jgi:hypothetical protein
MNYLDFLSQPPTMFIFQKDSNKTTFGGVLFLIYIIIMIIISLIYILDYFLNDKFIIEYSSYLNSYIKESSNIYSYLDIYNSSVSEYNPILNVSFNIFKTNESYRINLSDRFFIIDAFDFKELKRDTFYQKKVSDLGLIIGYKCEDENCTLNADDYSTFDYYLEIKYNGFDLNHQADIPLKNDSNVLFKKILTFSYTHTVIKSLSWEIIKYKEEKGISRLFDKLIGKNNEYTSGYISSFESIDITHTIIDRKKISDINLKIIAEFLMSSEKNYTEYKRRKISLLDVISKIGALFMTFYSFFIFIFKFYSKNFDNYKIVQSVFKNKLNYTLKDNSFKNIELTKIFENSNDNPLTDNKKDKDFSINNKEEDEDDDSDNIKKGKDKNFKKLTFAQFFLNNIYCKSCNKFKDQEIIRICNEIIANYLSVESLLYNQILMENIIKDYNWNNQQLNSLDNIELIIKLKELL